MSKPIAVIKVGGDVLLDEKVCQGLAANLRYLNESDWHIVLLHGGGPQVNQLQAALGLTPNKVAGRRITSDNDLQCVIQAIAGQVNVELCNRLLMNDLPVIGTHGVSGIIEAVKRPPIEVEGEAELVDFGAVGDVTEINAEMLFKLLSQDLIPVIATCARDRSGAIFNINADTTAVAIARALQANILCMVTAVGGIYQDITDPDSLINLVNHSLATKLIKDKVITDGMIAKVQEALSIVESGVGQVVITSLVQKNSMQSLLEAPDDYRLGTRILA